jgi:hypothetical protein
MATLASTDTALLEALYRKPAISARQAALASADPEPETRLWKVASDTFCSQRRCTERVLFLVLGLSGAAATISCFSVLLRLLSTDSISQTVKLFPQ